MELPGVKLRGAVRAGLTAEPISHINDMESVDWG